MDPFTNILDKFTYNFGGRWDLGSLKLTSFLDFEPLGGKFCAIRTILRQCSLLKRYTQTVQIGRFSEITKKNLLKCRATFTNIRPFLFKFYIDMTRPL